MHPERDHAQHQEHEGGDAEVIAFPGAPATTVAEVTTEATETGEVLTGEIVDDPPRAGGELVPPARAVARHYARRAAARVRRPDIIMAAVLKHELVYGSVGSARAAGALWHWVTARELDCQIATNPRLVLDTRRRRRNTALAGAGTTMVAGVATWLLVSPAAVIAAVVLVLAVAGAAERTRRTAIEGGEQGRPALGGDPSGREVRGVFVDAGLAKEVSQVRVIGPVTRDEGDGAWEATVELPPGTTYKKAIKRRGELAAAIGVDEVQLALDPVKGHAGRVRVWCADEDPMQGERVENPLVRREGAVNFWRDRVFAGRDPRGRPVQFSLVERSYLIGGEPGGGKSVASNNILGFVFMDPRVRVVLADGKFGFDLAAWEPMAAHVLTDKDLQAMIELLDWVIEEMDQRYALLRKIGSPKVTEPVADRYDMHPIVLHIDEIQYWSASGNPKLERQFLVRIADIVGRGRAAGIITGAITQRPAAEVVPTRLRDILSIRWGLRCTNPTASDTILGQGWASRGYSASLFEPDQRGAGYLLAEGGYPTQLRSAFLDPDRGEIQSIADRAYQLRKAAGTLPKRDDRSEVRLLNAILTAMEGASRIHSDMLVARLVEHHQEYADLTQESLAQRLRPLGVVPKGVWAAKAEDPETKTTRNGYEREAVIQALERA